MHHNERKNGIRRGSRVGAFFSSLCTRTMNHTSPLGSAQSTSANIAGPKKGAANPGLLLFCCVVFPGTFS